MGLTNSWKYRDLKLGMGEDCSNVDYAGTPLQINKQGELEVDKDKLIYELYRLLDDIDTIGDIARTEKEYRTLVEKTHVLRFKVCPKSLIEKLYDKYHDNTKELVTG